MPVTESASWWLGALRPGAASRRGPQAGAHLRLAAVGLLSRLRFSGRGQAARSASQWSRGTPESWEISPVPTGQHKTETRGVPRRAPDPSPDPWGPGNRDGGCPTSADTCPLQLEITNCCTEAIVLGERERRGPGQRAPFGRCPSLALFVVSFSASRPLGSPGVDQAVRRPAIGDRRARSAGDLRSKADGGGSRLPARVSASQDVAPGLVLRATN